MHSGTTLVVHCCYDTKYLEIILQTFLIHNNTFSDILLSVGDFFISLHHKLLLKAYGQYLRYIFIQVRREQRLW